MPKITYLDPIHCKANKPAINLIKEILSYEKTFFKQGPFSKKKVLTKAYFVDGRSGIFLSGFLPRIKKEFPEIEIDNNNRERLKFDKKPFLPGIDFRDYQIDGIYSALQKQIGIIKEATGAGKTYVAGGIISCFSNKNILYLCHNISILEQTKTDFSEKCGFSFNSIDAKSKKLKPGLTFSSIQSISNIPKEKYDVFFDIVIIDEAHRVCSRDSQYGKLLQNILSPIRIGFTATLPEKGEKLLSNEGLLGPVISELTIQEGIEKGIFVKPKITLIPVEKETSISNLFKYQEICSAVAESEIRNEIIIKEIIERIKDNKTCLIFIKDISHGDNLMNIVYEKYSEYSNDFFFVQGRTKKEEREEIRLKLENKEIKCVIATVVWKEGINIQSLNCIILAFMGKSFIQILQSIGRGTRISDGKTEVEVIDFIDLYKYLSSHFCERLTIYLNEGWL